MAHLTCKAHGKRVVFTETALIHRNGKGDVCATHENPLDIISTTNALFVPETHDGVTNLLQHIFSNEDYLTDMLEYESGYDVQDN